MPDYLAVPPARRDRAVHEKARAARRGELRWTRFYAADLDELFGEPVNVRFLDIALLSWASQTDWLVPYDTRAIAGRLGGLRGREVAFAVARLLELGRFELVTVQAGDNSQGIQPALFPADARQTSGNRPADARQTSGTPPADRRPDSTSGNPPHAASKRLAQSREEKRREEQAGNPLIGQAGENLPAELFGIGWNASQIRQGEADPDRARAWLTYARNEPGVDNLGGYTWARFSIPDTWPNGSKPMPVAQRVAALRGYVLNVLAAYPERAEAILELQERLAPIPPALRPGIERELVALLEAQEPEV